MKYAFIIAVVVGLSGCRVAYPSIGVKAPGKVLKWEKCITEHECFGGNHNCRKVVTCYRG